MENNIGETITEKIREGKIKMKSKAYFILRTLLLSASIIILLLFLVYLLSFIIFELRISGIWFLSQFGLSGIRMLLSSLPWFLIIISITMIVLLEFFAEKVEFVYKQPALYSLLGIIAVTITASFFIGTSPLHQTLLQAAEEGRLPLVGAFYQKYGALEFEDFHHGMVSEIQEDGFNMVTPRGERVFISVDQKFKDTLKAGNPILIIGKKQGHRIKASQFLKTNEDNRFFRNIDKRMKNSPMKEK